MISNSLPHKLPVRPLQAGSSSSPLSYPLSSLSSFFCYFFPSSFRPCLPFRPPICFFSYLNTYYYSSSYLSLSSSSFFTLSLSHEPQERLTVPPTNSYTTSFPPASPVYPTHMTDVSNPPSRFLSDINMNYGTLGMPGAAYKGYEGLTLDEMQRFELGDEKMNWKTRRWVERWSLTLYLSSLTLPIHLTFSPLPVPFHPFFFWFF